MLAVALLGSTAVSQVTAQEPQAGPQAIVDAAALAALCETNASDEDELALCKQIVDTVLAPDGQLSVPVVPTSATEFVVLLREFGTIGQVGGLDGVWAPIDPETGKVLSKKKDAKRARRVAGDHARALGESLARIEPDPCYMGLYVGLWGLQAAMDRFAAGEARGQRVFRAVINLFGAYEAATCPEYATG